MTKEDIYMQEFLTAKLKKEEKDPNGLKPNDPGAKLDHGKPDARLLKDFGLALMEVSKVLTFGANKYSEGGWTKVINGYNRYTSAMWRHLLQSNYNEIDEDSKMLHDALIAWNALARLEFKLREYNERTQYKKNVD